MAHHSRYLGELAGWRRDAVRALADAMIPKWRRATAPRFRVGKRQFERRITFVVPQISA